MPFEPHDAHVRAWIREQREARVRAWIEQSEVFRCYPRTMQQAFKQSEGYRVPIAGPYRRARDPMFRPGRLPESPRGALSGTMAALQEALLEKRPRRLIDRLSWAISVPALLLLAWALLRTPEHLLQLP